MGDSPRQQSAAWAASDARFRALLQHSSDITTVMAADGTVLFNTPSVERVLGYPPEEMVGQVALDFVHPDDLPHVATRFAESVAQPGVPVPVEFRFRHRDGRWVPLEAVGVNYLEDESIGGVVVNSRDLRERHRAESAYRTLVHHSLQGLAILQHGRVMFANQALADIMGYTVEELRALEPPQLRQTTHPEDLERLAQQSRARRSGVDVPPRSDYRVVRKDGTIRWVETYSSVIDYEGEPATHVAYVDITDRRRADDEKTALLQIARDLSGAFDRRQILDSVLKRTAALMPLDDLFVTYWDQDLRVYRTIARLGAEPENAHEDGEADYPPDHAIVTELRTGRSIVINDVDEQPWLPAAMLHGLEITSMLLSPLSVRDRASGALVAIRQRSAPSFSDEEVRLFDGIARQLALGLGAADRHEAEQEEAAIGAALANIGRELIASLSRPDLLPRLCEITARALGCPQSYTSLLDVAHRTYTPHASFGTTQEAWEGLRVLRVPEGMLKDLLARLREQEAVPIYPGDATYPGSLIKHSNVPGVVFLALRRGDEIIGLQSVSLSKIEDRFSTRQLRIARGIAQLASLSIEDARLVTELERANRLKSEFVATMSHELRTPLNIILGYNSLLLEDAFGPVNEEQRDTLERMDTNARSLLELINTTLDMSRLEAGQVRLELNEVRVEDVITALRLETRDLESKPEVAFVWETAPELPPLRTDVAKLKVVLKNLIGNAVKFTDRGSITVAAQPRGGGVEFAVSDTGIGIDEKARAYIFEPFRQVDAALTRRHGGVGLGLYIVRRLLNELGGTVDVESATGAGSTFRVWVPYEATP